MQLPRRRFLQLAAGAAALPAATRIARAQSYPSVAGGTLAVGRVARAAPDGYTVGIGQYANYVLNGATYPLQYDLLKDFAPVALLTTNPALIVAKAATPAKDLKELIVWLKANPGKASAATAGAGSPSHVAAVFFQNSIGTSFQFVPYRGNAPAIQDLVAGQIDVFFDSPGNSLAHVRAGRVKAYAVTAKTRIPSAPDIPTVDEAGAPGLYVSNWHGLWVPKATPKDAIARLNAAVVDALADATVHSRFADLGLERHRAGHRHHADIVRGRGASVGSSYDRPRVHCLCQGQSRQDQYGVGRERHATTHIWRIVQDDGRGGLDSRPVSGRGSRNDRSARWPSAGEFQSSAGVDRTH